MRQQHATRELVQVWSHHFFFDNFMWQVSLYFRMNLAYRQDRNIRVDALHLLKVLKARCAPTCHAVDGITKDTILDGGWSGFGACSKACGGGTQSRTCSDPAPTNGGKDCADEATKTCNTQACAGTACARMSVLWILLFSAGLFS